MFNINRFKFSPFKNCQSLISNKLSKQKCVKTVHETKWSLMIYIVLIVLIMNHILRTNHRWPKLTSYGSVKYQELYWDIRNKFYEFSIRFSYLFEINCFTPCPQSISCYFGLIKSYLSVFDFWFIYEINCFNSNDREPPNTKIYQ